jgi:hypothetical protein
MEERHELWYSLLDRITEYDYRSSIPVTPEQKVYNIIQSFRSSVIIIDTRSKQEFSKQNLCESYNFPSTVCDPSEVSAAYI